jgi:LuxR family maltose regulon positive regulatory protein
MARTRPAVHGDILSGDGITAPIRVGSVEWYAWLEEATAFAFVDRSGTFTARKQSPSRQYQTAYWYAFRKSGGSLYKVYLGRSAALSSECLLRAAASLAERTQAASLASASKAEGPISDALRPAIAPAVPPVRPALVARSRLYTQLDAGLHTPLTLITAPAGFGKTTLLAGWLHRNDEHGTMNDESLLHRSSLIAHRFEAAWLSLEAADQDLPIFLRSVIAALQTLVPTLGATTLALLQQRQPTQPELLLTTLLNDLLALDRRCLLILDDYHVVQAPAVHQALASMLMRLPPSLRVYMATREDPPLPLARLRASGQLTELRAVDLHFTPDEAVRFLNGTMGLALTGDEIVALEARTEGWIVGLQLAALAMRGCADREGFIAGFTGSHRFIVDYLADQVLDRLPPQLYAFVLQTSILDRLSGSLCDALLTETMNVERRTMKGRTANADSSFIVHHSSFEANSGQLMLEELERANLFLIPLDDQRAWYRYHPLFAEMVRERLRRSMVGSDVAVLHLRASRWWEQSGQYDAAIRHALAAQAFEHAADLIEAYAQRRILSGADGLESWLAALPADLWQVRPRLWLARAAALLAHADAAAIETCLRQAEHALRLVNPSEAVLLRRDIAAMQALMLSVQDDPRAIELVQHVLIELAEYHPLRGVLAAGLAFAYFGLGELAAARRTLTQALAVLPASNSLYTDRIALLGLLALVAWGEGRLQEVELLCQETLQLATGEHQLLPVVGTLLALLLLGVLMSERNDLAAAERYLATCADLARQAQAYALEITAQVYHALVLLAGNDRAGAQALLMRVEAAAQHQHLTPNTRKEIDGCRVLFWLRIGDQAAASAWAIARAEGDTAPAQRLTAYDYPRIAQARALIGQGQHAAAERLLARLCADAEATGHGRFLIWTLILQALLWHARGDLSQALGVLERALALAAPEGYLRLFVDEGAPMAALLRMARARGMHLAYVGQLLAAFPETMNAERGTMNKESTDHHSSLIVHRLVEPLTPRELEVLRLIAAGASNGAIAQQLVLSVGTVKKYVNSLFGKLDVHSRTQAIVRGQALGLL